MTKPVNPVLFYHPDSFRVTRQDLKGRHSAGESFLSAFIAQTPHPGIYALCHAPDDFREFTAFVLENRETLNARQVSRTDIAALRQQGLLNLADPQVAEVARIRSFHGDAAYPLCGVTHTISSRAILDSLEDMVVALVMPSDAAIMTSRAVEQAVSVVLDRPRSVCVRGWAQAASRGRCCRSFRSEPMRSDLGLMKLTLYPSKEMICVTCF